jgi:pimeloyl-ACP methyl ester carboxylesterase
MENYMAERQTVATRLGRVAFARRGQGTPVVLLHGNGHDHRDYDAIVPALSRFQTIAVDWPGCGASEAPAAPETAGVAAYGDALEDVIDGLGLASAVFVGNSVGGTTSIRLAARHPERVRALVLVDTGGFTPPSVAARATCWLLGREIVRRYTGARFARWYLKRKNAHVDAVLDRVRAARGNPASIAVEAALWRSFARPENDMSAEAASVRCPALIVWGRRDPVVREAADGRRAHAAIRGSRYHVLETGHVPFVEDPEAFLAVLVPFLDEVASRDGSDAHARA